MVRPRYIICSESRTVDRTSGLVTHYNVIEELTVSVGGPKAKAGSAPFLKFVVTAVWMRETGEEAEDTYEFETSMHLPGEEIARRIHAGEFQFGEHRFHRLETFIQGLFTQRGEAVPNDALTLQPGVLRLESRIRRSGDQQWLSQDYVIPVRVERGSPELADSSQGGHQRE